MLSYDYTKNLLNLRDAIIDKIENLSDTVKIHIHLPVKSHYCKECHHDTIYVLDYRIRTIKDISAFGKMFSYSINDGDTFLSTAAEDFRKKTAFLPSIIVLPNDCF